MPHQRPLVSTTEKLEKGFKRSESCIHVAKETENNGGMRQLEKQIQFDETDTLDVTTNGKVVRVEGRVVVRRDGRKKLARGTL
jgi:hypothetical protein